MDIDKIVTELIESRIDAALKDRLTKEMEIYGDGSEKNLREFITRLFNEVMKEKEAEIKAKIKKVVDDIVLQGDITNTFSISINFNEPAYALQERLRRMEGE